VTTREEKKREEDELAAGFSRHCSDKFNDSVVESRSSVDR